MTGSNRVIAAGNRYAFGGFLDDTRYLTGATSTAPASGATGSGMFQILGVKSASPTTPESDIEPVTGDDILLGEFQFDSIAERRFIVTFSIEDLATEAAIMGLNVETIADAKLLAQDIETLPILNMCFIFQSRAQKYDAGVKGRAAWHGIIVPQATCIPLGRETFEQRTAAVYRYSVAPQLAGYNPWGITVLDANEGTTGLRYKKFHSEYPFHMKRWTGTGAVTEFNLDFQPISAAKAYVVEDGIVKTVSAVNTTTNTVSVTGAPASNAAVVGFYQFQDS